MTNAIIVHDDAYRNWIFSPTHPTQGRRFINGLAAINAITPGIPIIEPRRATRAELGTVHDQSYLSRVLHSHVSNQWAGQRADMAELAALFAGGTLVALDQLIAGNALTAIHLPGAKHHAMRDHASGFCIFADFAMAAHHAVGLGYRVAILDIDAHHGDGTEALTLDEPRILTYSVHEDGIFPGTGLTSIPEKNAFNWPLPPDSGVLSLSEAVSAFILAADRHKADLIFIAGGADGHEGDPLSTLKYTYAGYETAMGMVRAAFPTTPILFGGAGGYQPDDGTPISWASMVSGLVRGLDYAIARR